MISENFAIGKRVAQAQRERKKSDSVYFQVGSDFRSAPYDIINYDTIQKDAPGISAKVPWPKGYLDLSGGGPWRFPNYDEIPRVLINLKPQRVPPDMQGMGDFWIVSSKMKKILETTDPTACDFRRCDTVLPSGQEGPETWLCSIVRAFVGAFDPFESENLISRCSLGSSKKSFIVHSLTRLKTRPEVVGSSHVFRLADAAGIIICDQDFKNVCRATGLKGLQFREISK